MDDEVETTLEFEDNSFPNPPKSDDSPREGRRDRRTGASQDKRIAYLDLLNRLIESSRLQAFDVNYYIRQLRHGSNVALHPNAFQVLFNRGVDFLRLIEPQARTRIGNRPHGDLGITVTTTVPTVVAVCFYHVVLTFNP